MNFTALSMLDLQLAERGKAASNDETPLQLNIANAVWAEQTYPFLQSFIDTLALNYGVGIRLADFINQYEAVRKRSTIGSAIRRKIRSTT
jgi:serpin B